MSISSLLFLNDEQLPSREEWQAALVEGEAGIVLDDIDDLRSHMGFFPVHLDGEISGFEWYYSPIEEMFPDGPPEWIGDRTHAIEFVTFGDMRELYCALKAGGILGTLADAVVEDGLPPEAWLNEAEEAKKHIGS